MFSIGEFARYGQVSVRMLRHYDSLGLLAPAEVEPGTGYRYYTAEQLGSLNRIIALKDLGFELRQVRAILEDELDAEQLRGMLRLRRAELEQTVHEETARLNRVEARLRTIEESGAEAEVVVKPLEPVRLAELTAVAPGYAPADIGPVIRPLFDQLCRSLETARVTPSGCGLARYEPRDSGVLVRAGIPITGTADGLSVVEIPGVERAATIVHHGSMDEVLPTAQALARWVAANGYQGSGYPREHTLACPENLDDWVTELQDPLD